MTLIHVKPKPVGKLCLAAGDETAMQQNDLLFGLSIIWLAFIVTESAYVLTHW
jgi:hypothetical protein